MKLQIGFQEFRPVALALFHVRQTGLKFLIEIRKKKRWSSAGKKAMAAAKPYVVEMVKGTGH
jgi:hypothetical protein